MDESGLKYHYVNPKFAGKPWMIERKNANSWGGKKKRHKKKRRTVRLSWRAHPELMDRQRKSRQYLGVFWKEFNACALDCQRMALVKKAANPPWKRIDEKLRLKLRREFAKQWCHLLNVEIESCGLCGNPWKEKHHIVPLSYGGLNESINLLAICTVCHDEIHPWLKSTA